MGDKHEGLEPDLAIGTPETNGGRSLLDAVAIVYRDCPSDVADTTASVHSIDPVFVRYEGMELVVVPEYSRDTYLVLQAVLADQQILYFQEQEVKVLFHDGVVAPVSFGVSEDGTPIASVSDMTDNGQVRTPTAT